MTTPVLNGLAALFSSLSGDVWDRIRDAPFDLREETLTEMFLLSLTRLAPRTVVYSKESSRREADTGMDWAWAIDFGDLWFVSLVQAKRASGTRFSVYQELRGRDSETQLANLLAAAANADAVPLYALYNNEAPSFGEAATDTWFGGCRRGNLTRGACDVGLPWNSGSSPMGITIVHANDVDQNVVGFPSAYQRSAWVNRFATPIECLLCPTWKLHNRALPPSDGGGPRQIPNGGFLSYTASLSCDLAAIATSQEEQSEEQSVERDFSTVGFHRDPPAWVTAVLERTPLTADDDAPYASYLVVTRLGESTQ